MVDGGIENMNHAVHVLCDRGLLTLILAQTDVLYSNSMIETFCRIMKHHWLYHNNLDNIAALRRLVRFYLSEHDAVLPHSALRRLTPDEVYFSRGENVLAELELGKKAARKARLEANRALDCETCKDMWAGLSGAN
jgi:hypothetical protein